MIKSRATSPSPRFTEKQGQYLAFIHAYTLVNGRPPAEADLQHFFGVTPPRVFLDSHAASPSPSRTSIHNMIVELERRGLITDPMVSKDLVTITIPALKDAVFQGIDRFLVDSSRQIGYIDKGEPAVRYFADKELAPIVESRLVPRHSGFDRLPEAG